ncbi:hypothetical protein HYS31_05785 [Candidatus Woesearchaeota archaeon]|nr:hypothetical protein [Candidatus Woesearchaeota archaeon]
MEIPKQALVAFHDVLFRNNIMDELEPLGYTVSVTDNLEKMLYEMGVDVSRTSMPNNRFSLYLMDANLDSPGSVDCSSAKLIHELIKPYLDKGEAKFTAMAARPETIQAARSDGVPCIDKDYREFSRFLETIQ